MTSEDLQDDLADTHDEGAPAPVIADPPRSRFLYVDVAALRAKQLRRGALPRLGRDTHQPIKAERVAMEEVRKGLVGYDLPEFKASPAHAE
jgi:DNA-directed RNA polymerase subunit K/omega